MLVDGFRFQIDFIDFLMVCAQKIIGKEAKPFLIQYFSNEQILVPLEGGDAMVFACFFQHIGEPCCLKWDVLFGFRNPHESTGG